MTEQAQPTTESPAPATTPTPTPTPHVATSDKLAPFRKLFGMPVAVQFAQATPYVQIAPMTDEHGNPQTVRVPESGKVIGLPAIADQKMATAVAIGVLGASEDGTWLVIEERLGLPRTAESLGGQALMDVYVRPEMVTHVSFVKAVEIRRPARDA